LLSAAQRGKGGEHTHKGTVRDRRTVSEYTQEREAAGISTQDASDWREAEHIPAETVVEYAQEVVKPKDTPTRRP